MKPVQKAEKRHKVTSEKPVFFMKIARAGGAPLSIY